MNQFAIVISKFNQEITDKLLAGALERFAEKGIFEKNIRIIKVPGAIEIPLIAKKLAETEQYQAIICLGAVIRGDTDHYQYVCHQVSHGCQSVMLTYNIPVIFGILTTENEKQALDRVGGSEGHKGKECADTALEMVDIMSMLK